MNWNDIRRIAVKQGFVFLRHGSAHDIYLNRQTGETVLIERHWSQEVKPGLQKKLNQMLKIK